MNIKFIKAERNSLRTVDVTYSLNDTEFTVEWCCLAQANRLDNSKIGEFDLTTNVTCDDEDIAERVAEAIKEGDTESNKDLALYLSIRDTFSHYDCMSLDTNIDLLSDELEVSDVQLYIYTEESESKSELKFSINYAISDLFMIQFDLADGFSTPDSNQAFWNNRTVQDIADNTIDADDLAEVLDLADNIKALYERFAPDVYGDKEAQALLTRLIA